MSAGLRRGAVVFVLRGDEPVEVTVLDRGPDGWWTKGEGDRDAQQLKSADLFSTRGEALKRRHNS